MFTYISSFFINKVDDKEITGEEEKFVNNLKEYLKTHDNKILKESKSYPLVIKNYINKEKIFGEFKEVNSLQELKYLLEAFITIDKCLTEHGLPSLVYPIKDDYNKELIKYLTDKFIEVNSDFHYVNDRLSKLKYEFKYLSMDDKDNKLYEYLTLQRRKCNNVIVNELKNDYDVKIIENIEFCTEPTCEKHFLNYGRDYEEEEHASDSSKNKIIMNFRYDQFKDYVKVNEEQFIVIMNFYKMSYWCFDIESDIEMSRYPTLILNNSGIDKGIFIETIKFIDSRLWYDNEITKLNSFSWRDLCVVDHRYIYDGTDLIFFSDILSITNK